MLCTVYYSLLCLTFLLPHYDCATLRLLQVDVTKEESYQYILDTQRYSKQTSEKGEKEPAFLFICRDADVHPIFESLLCPLMHILYREYTGKTSTLFPTLEEALEKITNRTGHFCSHQDQSASLYGIDSEGCISVHIPDKDITIGCAQEENLSTLPSQILPNKEEKQIIQIQLPGFSLNDLHLQKPLIESGFKCRLNSFIYANQLIIQDRICCEGAENKCVAIYHDQPGSSPWPLIRHVVYPADLGLEFKPNETRKVVVERLRRIRVGYKVQVDMEPEPAPINYKPWVIFTLWALVLLIVIGAAMIVITADGLMEMYH